MAEDLDAIIGREDPKGMGNKDHDTKLDAALDAAGRFVYSRVGSVVRARRVVAPVMILGGLASMAYGLATKQLDISFYGGYFGLATGVPLAIGPTILGYSDSND